MVCDAEWVPEIKTSHVIRLMATLAIVLVFLSENFGEIKSLEILDSCVAKKFLQLFLHRIMEYGCPAVMDGGMGAKTLKLF